jgi:hypothetical protein
MTPELYFSIAIPILEILSVVLLGLLIWLIILPLLERREKKRIAKYAEFQKHIEESVRQAVTKVIEELQKKE